MGYRVFVLYGLPSEGQVWKELEGLLTKGWSRKDGKKQHILACGIDARFETMHVENFIASFRTKASRIGCRCIRDTRDELNKESVCDSEVK